MIMHLKCSSYSIEPKSKSVSVNEGEVVKMASIVKGEMFVISILNHRANMLGYRHHVIFLLVFILELMIIFIL